LTSLYVSSSSIATMMSRLQLHSFYLLLERCTLFIPSMEARFCFVDGLSCFHSPCEECFTSATYDGLGIFYSHKSSNCGIFGCSTKFRPLICRLISLLYEIVGSCQMWVKDSTGSLFYIIWISSCVCSDTKNIIPLNANLI
jgi:hypothetical protein